MKLTRRDFIEQGSAATALGLLLPACSDDPDPGDGGVHDADTSNGDADGDSGGDADISLPECATDVLPEDTYEDCRVVRIYDRSVTDYSFGADEVCWEHIDGNVMRQMLEAAIIDIARASTIEEAWQALLPGDLSTALIAVKINLNGDEHQFLNNSPAMICALASSLIDAGAVAENMTFFDVSRNFATVYREAIETEMTGLSLLGGDGVPLHDTELVEAPTMVLEDGSHVAVSTPSCLVEADHFINLHVLKGHSGGATGAMKNLFGLARNVYRTFHGRGDWGLTQYHHGHQCGDLVTQPMIREKSRILIAEGIYGTWWHANKPPDRFRNEELFPDGMPCCVQAGRNPLYNDTVLFDLVKAERDYAPLGEGPDTYPEDWLRHCSEEPYNLGEFGHGQLIAGTFTPHDLAYSHINYRSFTTEG